MRLGIVCGLRSEAAALGPIGQGAAVSGANTERAYEGARRLAQEGAEALVSIGLAGALRADLRAGDLFLPETVVTTAGERFRVAPMEGQRGVLLGSDELADTVGRKERLAEASGAHGVDMESHAAARAGAETGLPFYVVRAISDDADQALPAAARGAVSPDGSVDTLRTLLLLVRRPQDLPALVRLGRQASLGHETLRSEGRARLLGLRDGVASQCVEA